jgi:hypothetical protein
LRVVGSPLLHATGSIACTDAVLRINVSLSDRLSGRVVFSGSQDGERDAAIALSQVTFDALAEALESEHPGCLKAPMHVRRHRS